MKNLTLKPPKPPKSGPKPPVLENALECFDRMRQAQEMLAKEGITVTDRFGQSKVHPAVLVERDAKAGLLRALKALNLQIEPLQDAVGRPPGN